MVIPSHFSKVELQNAECGELHFSHNVTSSQRSEEGTLQSPNEEDQKSRETQNEAFSPPVLGREAHHLHEMQIFLFFF